jgi:hypothetical protein
VELPTRRRRLPTAGSPSPTAPVGSRRQAPLHLRRRPARETRAAQGTPNFAAASTCWTAGRIDDAWKLPPPAGGGVEGGEYSLFPGPPPALARRPEAGTDAASGGRRRTTRATMALPVGTTATLATSSRSGSWSGSACDRGTEHQRLLHVAGAPCDGQRPSSTTSSGDFPFLFLLR